MGRPKVYDEPRIATAVRLPISLRDELQTSAAKRDVSVNYLVTRAVEEYLRRLATFDIEGTGPGFVIERSSADPTSP